MHRITKYAFERLRNGQPMLGVLEVPRASPIAEVIDDLVKKMDAAPTTLRPAA